MRLKYGITVADKNGKVIGNIDHIVMDSWSGEQRKFVVRREAPLNNIFFSPENVAGATGEKVTLNLALEELEQKA